MNKTELKHDLYKTIESWVGVSIQDSTLFFKDIGIDGLDCWTFIEQVAEKYNVDFNGYNWELYHMADADVGNILKHLYWMIFNKKRIYKKTFTAQHLYEVVVRKKWFEFQ